MYIINFHKKRETQMVIMNYKNLKFEVFESVVV